MIKIKNLNKYYNKNKENQIHVINDVTLELPDAGLISFLGPSGSGKTTLLNVIGGLDKAKGTIAYNDLEIEDYKMRKIDQFRSREIGYVFQNYNLLLEETVYNNLAIALEMIGIYDTEEQEKRIEYTLKAVGMYKYRKKRAYALSGGQQQRVSIARALVKKTKIIIADEPTGNLDSENTIEVMNILKKISKSSLVLLVTHNEEVANFYSDRVVKLQDGSIIDQYNGGESYALNTEQSNTIYLKDLELQEEKSDLLNFQYYTTGEAKPIDVRIIEKNGTYYISSSVKLKLVEDTNIKVIDGHYQALKQEHLEQFEYDTSWYNDSSKNKNRLKRFFGYLLKSFNKIRFAKRRTKFIYICFAVIGILLSVCMISFSNYIIADGSRINADKNYDIIKNDEYVDYSPIYDQLYELIDNGSIENLTSPLDVRGNMDYKYNFIERIDYDIDLFVIEYPKTPRFKFLAGKEPLENEIVISKKVADNFMAAYKDVIRDYDDILGMTLDADRIGHYYFDSSCNFTISGVCDNPNILGYLNEKTYLHYQYLLNNNLNEVKYEFDSRSFDIEKKYDTYKIVHGRDIENDDEILLSNSYSSASENLIGQTMQLKDKTYTIVGIFEFKDYETGSKTTISKAQVNSYGTQFDLCNLYTEYQVVEGRDIKGSKECVVSVYSKFNIGDKVKDLTVVGKYYADANTIGHNIIASREAMLISNPLQFYNTLWFNTVNRKNVESILSKGFYLTDTYNSYYVPIKEDNKTNLIVFGVLSLVLLTTISVFVYFIMRSRMIADIYPIGVYRSLGASKGKLYKQFVSDIFVTITLTSLIGYVSTVVIYQLIANGFNSMMNMNIFKFNLTFTFLGIVLMYALNFFFGLLPIHLLMRKTPAEIISKYDI